MEVLPIYGRQYCPCEVFAQVFSAEKRVFSFHLDSSDRRFSVGNERTVQPIRLGATFHADLIPPWSVMQRTLETIADRVRGERKVFESLHPNETLVGY